MSRVFPYTSFVFYRFLRALQQNRAQSWLLYLQTKKLFTFQCIANQIFEENVNLTCNQLLLCQISTKEVLINKSVMYKY